MEPRVCEAIGGQAGDLYRSGQFLCSEAIVKVVNEALGSPLPSEIVRMASGFPVGMGQAGCSCGALTGGVMALGLRYGRTAPGADSSEVLAKARELHDWFRQQRGSTCCRVLIKHLEFGSPEHLEQCIAITSGVAEKVASMIEE